MKKEIFVGFYGRNLYIFIYLQVVDFVLNGLKMLVINDNKFYYLNCLVQYRLVSFCREEVEVFLKGLNLLILDNLFSIFDENELEVKCSIYIYGFGGLFV